MKPPHRDQESGPSSFAGPPCWAGFAAFNPWFVAFQLLEENDQLIRCIVEYQNKGRAAECMQHQHTLHRNLIYLATIADAAASLTTEKTAVD
nr:SS18-like protein 2 [Pogona vitticeps]